jgi:hypothetical protein
VGCAERVGSELALHGRARDAHGQVADPRRGRLSASPNRVQAP